MSSDRDDEPRVGCGRSKYQSHASTAATMKVTIGVSDMNARPKNTMRRRDRKQERRGAAGRRAKPSPAQEEDEDRRRSTEKAIAIRRATNWLSPPMRQATAVR